jgi:rubrerythrin
MNSDKAFEACRLVLEWAKTPGEHGGNPYLKPFVKAAEEALAAQPITWVCESCEASFQAAKSDDPAADFCPFCGADEGAAYDVRDVTFLLGGGFVLKSER